MNTRKIKVGILIWSLWATSGCLTTRAELRDAEVRRTQVSAAQERKAQESARMDEVDGQMRAINGRVDVLENHMAQLNAGYADKQSQEQKGRDDHERKLRLYEEALKKMDLQIQALGDEVKELRVAKAKQEAQAPTVKDNKDHFVGGDEAFNRKDWKQAILDFEAYRKNNPKGKKYAQATLKIGLSFAELGMKDEARAFFEEVESKFPSSKEAKKAAVKLKGLK